MARSLADGARDVAGLEAGDFLDDDGLFLAEGAVGVEELIGDVGEDGGAARGDAALGDEDEEAGEELVDGDSGVEFGGLGEEIGGEVFGVAGRLQAGGANGGAEVEVAGAKTELGIEAGKTAALAVG